MNKKIFLAGAVLMLGLGVVGCAGNNESKVLANPEATYVFHGNNQYKAEDGTYVDNNWNAKSNELYEATTMTAASLKDVKALDEDLYASLKKKSVKYLYTFDKAVFGAKSSGWTTNCTVGDKVYKADGSFAFKVPEVTVTEEDGVKVYVESQWIPHDHDMNVENLTPSSLWLSTNFAEQPDENGFSWDYNPVCTAGAGEYTVVLAVYTTGSSAETYGAGLALVKTKEVTAGEGVVFEEYVAPAEITWGLVGTITNWGNPLTEGGDPVADIPLVKQEDGSFKAEHTFAANDEWKVRQNGAWDVAKGSEILTVTPAGAMVDAGEPTDGNNNIVVVTAGTYVIVLNADATALTVTAK